MSSQRHEQVTALFSRACELKGAERDTFLDEACAADQALRRELETLLAYDERAGDFYEETAAGQGIEALLEFAQRSDDGPPLPERIGAYKILGLLGEGGQGIVFEAEQQTPRRKVALKVLRGGSFATEDGQRRFRREIQALAVLRHPSIATIHDGGHTEDGYDFFTMELVTGEPINEFVARNDLSAEGRLELFCAVCDGVQYAHRKGIIHRDLKPTNVMVSSAGEPRILDFGLARIMGVDSSQAKTPNAAGSVVGSLRYMSPEQARGGPGAIAPQTDVYSLGVILYEILTGRYPYDIGKSLPDAVRAICETTPARPRSIEPTLPADLDTVVSKALAKDPAARYESIEALAGDVRRVLRGDPIKARRSNLVYVAARKIRKHRVIVALGTVMLFAVLARTAVDIWSTRRDVEFGRMEVLDVMYNIERLPAARSLRLAQTLHYTHPGLADARLALAQTNFRVSQEVQNPLLGREALYILQSGPSDRRSGWAFRMLAEEIRDVAHYPDTIVGVVSADDEMPDSVEAQYLASLTTLDRQVAIRYARAALEREPRHVLALTRLAFLCERTGDLACTLDATAQLLEYHAGHRRTGTWILLRAHVLTQQKRYREAIALQDSEAARRPSAWRNQGRSVNRAVTFMCLGEYERALEDFNVAVVHGYPVTRGWYRYHRATANWILGHFQDAAADLRFFRHSEGYASFADARLFLLRHDEARHLERRGRAAEAAKLREEAELDLALARKGIPPDSWLGRIFRGLAGEMSPEELLSTVEPSDREQVCEGYYYAAEIALLYARRDEAMQWFRDCVATDLRLDTNQVGRQMNEFYLARWRLKQLGAFVR